VNLNNKTAKSTQGVRLRPHHSSYDTGNATRRPTNSPTHIQPYNQIGIPASAAKIRKDHHATKTGENPTDVTTYRAISLLSVIPQILEKLLLKRIYNDTHSQTWIPMHQFGLRKAHSTIQICHRLTDIINKALDNQKYCSAVFLDVSQAFDKVWHQGLLQKIKQTRPQGTSNSYNHTYKTDNSW